MSDLSEQRLEQIEKVQRDDHDATIRIEEKLGGFIQEMRLNSSGTNKILQDHESRLTRLERRDEVDLGIKAAKTANVRLLIATLGVAAAIVTAVTSWALAKGHL